METCKKRARFMETCKKRAEFMETCKKRARLMETCQKRTRCIKTCKRRIRFMEKCKSIKMNLVSGMLNLDERLIGRVVDLFMCWRLVIFCASCFTKLVHNSANVGLTY